MACSQPITRKKFQFSVITKQTLSLYIVLITDAFGRVIFTHLVADTRVIWETRSPTWDQMLVFKDLILWGDVNEIAVNPPTIVIEVFDKDIGVSERFFFSHMCKQLVLKSAVTCNKLHWNNAFDILGNFTRLAPECFLSVIFSPKVYCYAGNMKRNFLGETVVYNIKILWFVLVVLGELHVTILVSIFSSVLRSRVSFNVWHFHHLQLTYLMNSVFFCIGWLGVHWPCSGQTHCQDGLWALWETVLPASTWVVPDFQGGRESRRAACCLWASSGG